MILFGLVVAAVVASIIGIGVLCTFISPWCITIAVGEGLTLGWLCREMYF